MRTLEQNFVPYEIASELKDLGFDEPCFGYYLCKNSAFGIYIEITSNWLDLLPYDSSSCKAPLYQQALEFFREKYNLYIEINLSSYGMLKANINTLLDDKDGKRFITICDNICYEDKDKEVKVKCLKKLIEIVKEKN